jgi:hypothetical protein
MARQHLTDFELMILLAVLRIGDDAYERFAAKRHPSHSLPYVPYVSYEFLPG